MHRLETMKETLMNCVQGQLGDLASVDAKELGEAIDMIKDLSEAIYYCTITDSMEKSSKEERYYRDMDKDRGSMYYTDSHGAYHPSANSGYPIEIRDSREGRSPITRKTYMERKMHGGGKEAQMHELEKYMQELSSDIIEMIEDATPEEKQMLKSKISALATKIV